MKNVVVKNRTRADQQ